jgi:predicted aconitase with swiveling domain
MIAQAMAAGDAEGPALVLSDPVSFWGGVDIPSGRIIDRSHPQLGTSVTRTILVMPGGRGSSSSSSVLAEMIRLGTAPAGIILAAPDGILTVGALVAQSLYAIRCPIVVCPIAGITTGERLCIEAPDSGDAIVRSAAL